MAFGERPADHQSSEALARGAMQVSSLSEEFGSGKCSWYVGTPAPNSV